jgi:teichuronic acid biosynthesis glycosyltransferase TuaG
MSESKLISIIMPACNAGSTIKEAIDSVVKQSHSNWELLIVNNASTDNTSDIVLAYTDERITLLQENERGVSRARNAGLEGAKGEFICFLDADDVLPEASLSSRLAVFGGNESVRFADGIVLDLESRREVYRPNFKGEPIEELCKMNSSCFFGNTWMIRTPVHTRFRPELSHCEDLMFYMEQASPGLFGFTEEVVLLYRRTSGSAMTDLDGLETGYKTCFAIMKGDTRLSPFAKLFAQKARSIMWKSYLKSGRPMKALQSWLQFFS